MNLTDPFDAEHPDNMPAYFADQRAEHKDDLWNPAACTWSEWRAILAALAEYPREVGFDARTGRLQLPIGYDEWTTARTHPCWPEYREQMQSLPAGHAIGFGAWMGGGCIGRSDAASRARPTRPFLCDPFTELPKGWARGDPNSTDALRPYRQVAYDPARHCVVRSIDSPSAATHDRLSAAGFQPLTTGEPGRPVVTYYVRDRAEHGRATRSPAIASRGRSL